MLIASIRSPAPCPSPVPVALCAVCSREQSVSWAEQSPEGLVIDDDSDALPEPVLYIPPGVP
jgi:hypothetical protein